MNQALYSPSPREGMRGHPTDLVIADVVSRHNARKLFDVGCGNGRDALQLIRVGLADTVIGIDNGSEPHNSRIHMVKQLVPADLRGRLLLVEGDYHDLSGIYDADLTGRPDLDAAILAAQSWENGADLAYTNNVLEHLEKPEDMLALSLELAPLAVHVVPCERHGWCDDHQQSWTVDEFSLLLKRFGSLIQFGVFADPPPFPCYEKDCRHLIMFGVIGR